MQLFLAGRATRKFITLTYRETNKQPNLQLAGLQLQQAVALLTFTAQCFSYPPSFFPLLLSLKAHNFLISKVVSSSLGNAFKARSQKRWFLLHVVTQMEFITCTTLPPPVAHTAKPALGH